MLKRNSRFSWLNHSVSGSKNDGAVDGKGALGVDHELKRGQNLVEFLFFPTNSLLSGECRLLELRLL